MVEIRPTLQVLKALREADLLSSADAAAYDDAKRIDDTQLKLKKLASLDLSDLDVNLLRDARTLVGDGKYPDSHRTSSRAAQSTIYELRDHSGGAWRGAGLLSRQDDVLWVILTLPHDQFHSRAASRIESMRKSGHLGPSSLDSKLLNQDRSRIDRKTNRIHLLTSLIEALQTTLRHGAPAQVEMPSTDALNSVEMFVTVSDVPNRAEDWDTEDAPFAEAVSKALQEPR